MAGEKSGSRTDWLIYVTLSPRLLCTGKLIRITLEQADQPFIHRLLGEELDIIESPSAQETRLLQKNHEADLDWKRNAIVCFRYPQ